MQTIEYTSIDKSKWDNGPWQNEPDKKQWQDPVTGYPCLIVRAPVTGALCGYVGLKESHPLYGVSYNQSHECTRELWKKAQEGDIGKRGMIPLFCSVNKDLPSLDVIFDVHGSLTFSGECIHSDNPAEGICHIDESGDKVFWQGFDTSHSGDVSPAMNARLKTIPGLPPRGDFGEEYRDIEYVTKEVESLAQQLKDLEK